MYPMRIFVIKKEQSSIKSVKCILLGVSKESKAYRLYEPIAQKIIISKDVVFEEACSWGVDRRRKMLSLFAET